MTQDEVRAAVVAERRELAAMLAGLRAQQWDAPTLCGGWRVREVVAHTTMAFRTSLPKVIVGMVRARGDFNRMADRAARRDAAAMTAPQLLAQLRDNAEHPWTPPGGGSHGALSHEVIHGLDVTVALGVERRPPPDRVGLVLSGLRPKNVAFFGADLSGVRLTATDGDWTYGTGEPLRGAAQDLLLVVCGRRVPPGRLDGAAAARFTRSTGEAG